MDTADDVGFATIHPHLDASSRAAAFPNPKGGRGGGGAGGMVASGRSVHELLECPVCINSMYPPIHQDVQERDLYFYPFCNLATPFNAWRAVAEHGLATSLLMCAMAAEASHRSLTVTLG